MSCFDNPRRVKGWRSVTAEVARFSKLLIPTGVIRLSDYRRRLIRLGIPPRFAFSRRYRSALDITHLDLLTKKLVASLRVVVDVGANVGEWSVGTALLANPEQIIAFEPNPSVFARLQENVAKFPQIRCVPAAIGAHAGSVELKIETNCHPFFR